VISSAETSSICLALRRCEQCRRLDGHRRQSLGPWFV
jgi:hypothetical protein